MEFIVITHLDSQNICKEIKSDDITISTLKDELKLVNSLIYIVTPNYQILLRDDQKPNIEYPELIQGVALRPHQRPKYYLLIIPELISAAEDQKDVNSTEEISEDVTVFLHVQSDQKLPFRIIPFEFKRNEVNSLNNFFELCQKKFPLKCDKILFSFSPMTKDLNNSSSLEDLLKYLRYGSIVCDITVVENSDDFLMFKERSDLINSFIIDEKDFIHEFTQLDTFWQPFMTKEQLLEKDDASFVFNSFKSTTRAHNFFLQEFKNRAASISMCVGDLFCDLPLFFDSTNDLFSNYQVLDLFFKIKCQNTLFLQKIDNATHHVNYHITPFFDLLFLPISRFNDFFMFFLKLKKLTPEIHPDFIFFQEGELVINKFLSRMKLWLKKEPTGLLDVVNIQNKLINRMDIMSPRRALLSSFHGVYSSKYTTSGYFYIFNDLILVTKIGRRGEKGKYKMTGVDFRYLTDFRKIIINVTDKKSISFTFESKENFEFALQQIDDLKNLFYVKLRINDRLVLYNLMDKTSSLNFNIAAASVNMNNSCIYLIGGYAWKKFPSNISVLNMKNKTVKTVYNPLVGRKYHAAAENKGIIYVFGGMNSDSQTLGDFISINTKSGDSMQKITSLHLPTPRFGHSLISTSNYLIMFGGIDHNKTILSDTSIYTFSNAQWKSLISSEYSPCERAFHSAVVLQNKMIIHGGISSSRVLDDVVMLDLSTMTWITPKLSGDILLPRHSHKVVVYQNWMLVVGGTNESGIVLPPFGIHFDGTTGHVTNFATGGNDRPNLMHFAMFVEKNEIFIVGGADKNSDVPSRGIFRIPLPKIVLEKQAILHTPSTPDEDESLNTNERPKSININLNTKTNVNEIINPQKQGRISKFFNKNFKDIFKVNESYTKNPFLTNSITKNQNESSEQSSQPPLISSTEVNSQIKSQNLENDTKSEFNKKSALKLSDNLEQLGSLVSFEDYPKEKIYIDDEGDLLPITALPNIKITSELPKIPGIDQDILPIGSISSGVHFNESMNDTTKGKNDIRVPQTLKSDMGNEIDSNSHQSLLFQNILKNVPEELSSVMGSEQNNKLKNNACTNDVEIVKPMELPAFLTFTNGKADPLPEININYEDGHEPIVILPPIYSDSTLPPLDLSDSKDKSLNSQDSAFISNDNEFISKDNEGKKKDDPKERSGNFNPFLSMDEDHLFDNADFSLSTPHLGRNPTEPEQGTTLNDPPMLNSYLPDGLD
ncbi:hypothetical protein TRFO_17069 [Tritrichomonas foetus]|uniref:DH domain-containing protein n=1 Tax=Tritrichomonas foetus TaxID=1144522 RepID=A0A1J4KTD7_9EUKA|nr:hypothetical protein TRFO_17069 [Tritrichomonas foetus]|eukprot:OHT12918.1 hypothetical protein TRFO_17069 [Tritrichomonas foetus]